MTARQLLRILRRRGCVEVRRRGSHLIVRCGDCQTVVPVHAGETLKARLLRAVERQLEPCLKKRWLQ